MIIAYTGMPGGGKTTALAWRAYKAQKQGRMVFSNVNIKGTYKITFEDIIEFRFPEGCDILIDESGRWFNSRKWASLPEDVFDLFTMHRHLQTNLYIAVQSFARIDKSLREVVELVYWSRNSPMLPFHKYEGFYDLEKVGSMKGEHNVSHLVWKTRKIRGMFNTHSMKNQFAHKQEIPLIEWDSLSHANKKLAVRLNQKMRVNYKLFKRRLKKSFNYKELQQVEKELFMQHSGRTRHYVTDRTWAEHLLMIAEVKEKGVLIRQGQKLDMLDVKMRAAYKKNYKSQMYEKHKDLVS